MKKISFPRKLPRDAIALTSMSRNQHRMKNIIRETEGTARKTIDTGRIVAFWGGTTIPDIYWSLNCM
jgi:hypothetical protein